MGKKIKNLEEYTAKTLLGAELFNQKKYQEAVEVFLLLADYNKKNFKVYETLAMTYLKLNDIASADEAYKKARALFSEQSGIKMELKTFDEAVSGLESIDKLEAQYEESLKNPKSYPDAHKLPVMISLHYMAKGQFRKAEDILLEHKEKYLKK